MQVQQSYSDLFKTTMLPAIQKVIILTGKTLESKTQFVFNKIKSDRSLEQVTQFSGFRPTVERQEGTGFTEDEVVQGYDKSYVSANYGLKMGVTQEMMDDLKIPLIKKMSVALVDSSFDTEETLHWNVFVNAFTAGATAGPDGVALCATNHPMYKTGSTQSNRLTTDADLNFDSVRTMKYLFERTKNDDGIYMNNRPDFLLHAPENDTTADELLASTLRPDNNNNAVNALKGYGLQSLQVTYLEDPDAFFMVSKPENNNLDSIVRKERTLSSWMDNNTKTAYTSIEKRFTQGFSNYIGVAGTPGI